MSGVVIEGLKKVYGDYVAVSDFNLEIKKGELIAFLGPSGCGKTTTLRMVAGFITPTAGNILVNGRDISQLPPHRRNTGMVFQRYALFPHMTVEQNVAFGLDMRKIPRSEQKQLVKDALDMVQLSQLSGRYPREMSGGQQQRVAIARALVIKPDVFLLDEPLSNLDAKLRVKVREEIKELQQRLGLTTIFVTHDREEAITIADRLAVMHEGRIQQVGTPTELYDNPQSAFVADFLGDINVLRGASSDRMGFVTERGTALPVSARALSSSVGIRPERVVIADQALSNHIALEGTVSEIIYKGSLYELRVTCGAGDKIISHVTNGQHLANNPVQIGSKVFANFTEQDCHFFQ